MTEEIIKGLSTEDRGKLDEYFTNPENALQADMLKKYFLPPVKPAKPTDTNIFDDMSKGIGALFGSKNGEEE